MSSGKAQDRLDKLKNRLKTEKSSGPKIDGSVSKSSVTKKLPKNREKNLLEKSSIEKKLKIKELLLAKNLTKVAQPTPLQEITKSSRPVTENKVPSTENFSKKTSAQMRLKKMRPVAPKESKKVVEKPQVAPNAEKVLQKAVNPSKTSPQSLKSFKIPKKIQESVNEKKQQVQELKKTIPPTENLPENTPKPSQNIESTPRPVKIPQPAKPPILVQNLPNSSKNVEKNCSPQVERNLFRRKRDSSSISQQHTPRPEPLPEKKPADVEANAQVDGGPSKFRQLITKTCRGVVDALKGTFSSGSEFLSGYSYNRSDVSQQLQDARTQVDTDEMMDFEITCSTFENEMSSRLTTDLFLVIDTNVVIHNLRLLKSIKHRKVKEMTPKVIVPWQVLKELDYLKDLKHKGSYIHNEAREGIRFLFDEILSGDGFVNGQPQQIASRQVESFDVEVPDDHLIKCCLQVKSNQHNFLLLTNDKNLVIKAVICGVPSMRCDEFSKICQESETSDDFTCFELPPSSTLRSDSKNCAEPFHRVVMSFRYFLTAVLKKYWMFKFSDLWKLRTPGVEPWSLTCLLEKCYEVWVEITSSPSPETLDSILYLRRFINKTTYEQLRYSEVEQFARTCLELARTLPPSFEPEARTFDTSLAFLKRDSGALSTEDLTFMSSCKSLALKHFELFETRLVLYCYNLSQQFNIPFTHPKILMLSPEEREYASLNDLSKHMEAVKQLGRGLLRVSPMTTDDIVKSTCILRDLYTTLTTYLGDESDPRFVLEDVVEFCKDENIRKSFHTGIKSLETLATYLEDVRRRYLT